MRILLCAAALVLVPTALAATSPSRTDSGPTLAVEDTMRTEVSPVLVKAPRVTLDEILDRVARGEARRESLMRDQSFLATMRVMRNVTGKGRPEMLVETVTRVYKRRPNLISTIELRHWELKPDKKKDSDSSDVNGDFSAGFGERMVNFAFQPDARRRYRYRIEDRRLFGDHVIYRIAFEPISALAFGDPSGVVWVDTKEFVIVRQELAFKHSPMPLFLKDLPRMVVERQKVGEQWVMSRVLMRMELTIPVPKFGRSFDFALATTEHTVNTGLPDSLFRNAKTEGAGAHVKISVGGSSGKKGGSK